MSRGFRIGDPVVVTCGGVKAQQGRVICTDRKDKYGLCVIVLVEESSKHERVESFKSDGTRYVGEKVCIKLGKVKNNA